MANVMLEILDGFSLHTLGFYKALFHKDHSPNINIKANIKTVTLNNVTHIIKTEVYCENQIY